MILQLLYNHSVLSTNTSFLHYKHSIFGQKPQSNHSIHYLHYYEVCRMAGQVSQVCGQTTVWFVRLPVVYSCCCYYHSFYILVSFSYTYISSEHCGLNVLDFVYDFLLNTEKVNHFFFVFSLPTMKMCSAPPLTLRFVY